MIRAWVIGAGGLLGSALCRAIRAQGGDLFYPSERLLWNNPDKLFVQFYRAIDEFSGLVGPDDHWEIHWAAGIGTMNSSAQELKPESLALSVLLDHLTSDTRLPPKRGFISFASSAGGIYAASQDEIINEFTLPAPNTRYGHEKLKQEDLIREFVCAKVGVSALIARISTLYGPGQARSKKQGLLSHIARCLIRNEPVHIYVPFDTIRDYVAADDAAYSIIASLRTIVRPGVMTQIIASEQPTSIAEIISIFKHVAHRPLRIITSANRLSDLYCRRILFRSQIALDGVSLPKTTLPIGISRLLTAERVVYASGQAAQV